MDQTRELNGRKVVISLVYPPIPIRNKDWQACFEGNEEFGPFGWGETADEAFKDLIGQLEEYDQLPQHTSS